MPLPRPSRRTLKGLALLAFLGLVFLAALALSLRTVTVRRAILERVTAYLEKDLGIQIQADDVDFDRTGGIDLRGLRIGVPGAPPFATAEQARIVPALRSLRSDVIVLRSVEVIGPRIDLNAPIPQIRQKPPEPGARTRRIDVLDFRIDRGEIVAAPLPPDLAHWVESWGVRDLSARGSYRGEKLEVEARAGEIRLHQPGQAPQLFKLAAKAAGRLDQPLEIRDLHLTGDGLALTASGTAALAAEGPFSGRFRLETEPGRVVPRLVPGGRLQAAGSLTYPGLGGQVSFQGQALPAEAVRGFLDPALYADLSLAGTVVDANGDLTLDPGAPEKAHGPVDLTWRRADRALARLEISAAPEPGPEAPLNVAFQGDLLPGSAGKRHVQGTLLTPSWAALLEARNQGTDVVVQSPDLAASLAELRTLWPRLVPRLPPDLPVRGSLEAKARLNGPFTAPLADLNAVWNPEPGARVAVQAQRLRLPAAEGAAQVEIASLPLDAFATGPLAGLEGTLSGTGDLSGSLRAYRTRLNLDAAGLRVPVPGGPPATVETARVNADGTLRPKSLAYDGSLILEGNGLIAQPNASSTARLAHFRVATGGATDLKRTAFDGFLTLEAQDLTLDGDSPIEVASVYAQADGRFSPDLRSTAALWSLKTDGLRLPTLLPDPIEANAIGRIADGEAWIPSLAVFAGDRAAAGTTHLTLEPLLREADLDLQLSRPFEPAVRTAEVTARLRQGVLTLDIPRLEGDAGTATLQATVPLGSLDSIPELRDALAALPVEHPKGPVSVALKAPALDSATLLAALCLPDRPERLRTGLDLALTVDPASPAAGTGEIRLTGFQLETGPSHVTAEDDLVLRLANTQLAIPPVRLRIESPLLQATDPSSPSSQSLQSFELLSLQGTAALSPTWHPGQPPADLVTRLDIQGEGTVEAALLNPYLEGGIAEGPLTFKADLAGPLATLDAKVHLSGTEASLFFPGPFPTRLEGLAADLTFREGKARLESTSRLNGGPLTLEGDWDPKLGGKLSAVFTGARYRLPDLYNLSASLSGVLQLQAPAQGRWTLGGALVVDRGVINRDIDLDQQVLAFLAPAEDADETDPGLLGQIDLELTLTTVDGVRVQNNIGDLRAVWSPLVIRGTLAQPDMRGRIDLEPGGLVFAYGQSVRIDRGALVFTGPINEPEPELSVTTSLQDPTIGRLRGRSPLDELDRPTFDDPEKSLELERSLTEGVAGYYGERFASRLGSSLGLSRFTIRPVLVFQETDPTARLTVSRELSPYASFALSLDLRNAERQSYLLDLYGLRGLPRLTLQGYRTARTSENIAENTVETYGGTLQQTLELGGSAPKEAEGPRLRRVLFDDTGGLSHRRLRRALAVDRGDPIPSSAPFDLEEDLSQALGRRGYPDARVAIQATTVPTSKNKPERTDLHVTVEPGPHVTFAFEGRKPPRSSRSSITGLYRTDFYEPTSLEEVKSQTVRVFRSLGYLDPQVSLEVRKGDKDQRTVTIHTNPGRRAKIETLVPEGLAPDAAVALLAGRLQSRLARVELAAALPDADRRLLQDLDALGYPDARIAGRALSEDGKSLSLEIEAGPRRTFGEITLAGVEGPERARLQAVLRIHPGDPAVTQRLARAALDLEDDLKRRGYFDATVRPLAVPSAPGQMDVRFDITPGTLYRIQTVAFEGERSTRDTALESAAQIPAGTPLSQETLNEARNRLFQTGLFSRVLPDIEKDPDGQARVTFQLQERPRFRIAYGLRWDSEDGTSAVVDLVDQNLLGRGLTLGLRTLYEPNDQSGRLFFRTGGLFGSRISLESFGEYRHIETEDDFGAVLLEDRTEGALQLSRPFGTNTTGRLYLRRRSTWTREQDPDPFFPLDIRLENTYLGVQTIYDTRNDLLEPTRGLFATLDLSGSGSFVGSDFEYARAFGQLNTYRRVATWNNRPILWAQSTRLGVARPFGGQELLRDVSFFAGGEYSVRGYDKESLGPRENLGGLVLPSGGEALVVLNEEIRFPLPADLTGLLFFDLGQVWGKLDDVDGDLAKSVGLGLRVRTPVGLLRGDVAFPLDGRERERDYRFYLGFGNVF